MDILTKQEQTLIYNLIQASGHDFHDGAHDEAFSSKLNYDDVLEPIEGCELLLLEE